jgi:hypothetical protein
VSFKLDYWQKEGLPNHLASLGPLLDGLDSAGYLGQHKYLPYREWFAGPLRGTITSMLTDSSVRDAHFWNARSVECLLDDHASGRHNRLHEIHSILLLGSVERTLISGWRETEPPQLAGGATP